MSSPPANSTAPKYRAFTLQTYRQVPQLNALSDEEKFAIDVVGHVLPFRINNYVIEQLIDWENVPNDPIYRLTVPQQGMLRPEHFNAIAKLLANRASAEQIRKTANAIRLQLNPHPAGQLEYNVPTVNGIKLTGVQHKYRETLLFFPSQGQTCHAYCTFCFRWPQFVNMNELKFAMKETELLIEYIRQHPEVTDILFTGGDPMIMRSSALAAYIEPLLTIDHIHTIRIGTKALSYYPYRFTHDNDADDLMRLFEKVGESGKHLAIMGHFNHHQELRTPALEQAVAHIRNTGAQIRTQSPLMRHINDDPMVWSTMWRRQVDLGMIPYYMFLARDTGAQHYFAVPMVKAWQIFREAYQQVSGICRTVRGPSASATPGKIQVLGVSEINGKKVIALRFLQGRNPDWVHRPFFAEYDEKATWVDELVPAFGEERFFFEEEEMSVAL